MSEGWGLGGDVFQHQFALGVYIYNGHYFIVHFVEPKYSWNYCTWTKQEIWSGSLCFGKK